MLPWLCLALGVLNLTPGAAVFAPSLLGRLYGVQADQPELRVVLRHRAVLLALVGGALVIAAREPAWVLPAFGFALISKGSFLAVYVLEGRPRGPLARVARADSLAVLAMAGALPFV